MAVLETRVAGREGDASDATVAVLREQARRLDGQTLDWPRVSTNEPSLP
jgi:predicted kinase